MAPVSQQLPSSPREAIQLMRDALDRMETQPLVRDYQAVGTGSASATASRRQFVTREITDGLQKVGIGFTSLAVWIAEAAQQQQQQSST